jgi:Lrp/AsnC family transcriptional regulator, regulator for asnA, asnC and gidA
MADDLRQNRLVSEMTLDDTNRAIIRLLQLDGRRAYADIAKEVGLSEAAVRQRVRRLLDGGVIQIVAVTDQIQMGYPRAAMISINVDGDVQAAAKLIGDINEVDYLVSTAGGIDLLAEVFATDDQHLFTLLNRIRGIDGVRNAQTYMYFKIHKQTYHWGAK